MVQSGMTSALREPVPVQFAYAGGWHPGVLLGWRQDDPDHCRLRVQCVVGGLRRTTWMRVADVRLPESTPPLALPHPRAGGRPFPASA